MPASVVLRAYSEQIAFYAVCRFARDMCSMRNQNDVIWIRRSGNAHEVGHGQALRCDSIVETESLICVQRTHACIAFEMMHDIRSTLTHDKRVRKVISCRLQVECQVLDGTNVLWPVHIFCIKTVNIFV